MTEEDRLALAAMFRDALRKAGYTQQVVGVDVVSLVGASTPVAFLRLQGSSSTHVLTAVLDLDTVDAISTQAAHRSLIDLMRKRGYAERLAIDPAMWIKPDAPGRLMLYVPFFWNR